MKTIPVLIFNSASRAWGAVTLTVAVFSAVLLGGVSAQAGTTNYYWNNTSSDYYTNDADWVVGAGNFAPMGLNAGQLASHGSTNYAVYVTNNGAILYGDGGGGNSSGYTWTNVLGYLNLGGTNGNGTINMNSDSLTISNVGGSAFEIGLATNSSGTFNMSGGTLNVIRDASTLYQDSAIIGNSANSAGSGTFTISGGVANFLCGVEIGEGGTGTFNVNGGVTVDNGWFGVGHGGTSADCQGVFNLTAGVLYILRNSGNDGSGARTGVAFTQAGYAGTANISGGTLYCEQIQFNSGTVNPTNTLNISGGTIYVGFLGVWEDLGGGGSIFPGINISGGTFHTADMLQVSTSANAGNTNTILSDGTNWVWNSNMPVNLTNSTFLVNGTAGPGYVTFAPETNRTITLSNQWSGVGGFVVDGSGTVISANNGLQNVVGGITVSNGTLVMCGPITNTSPIFVGTNSVLYIGTNETVPGTLTASNVTLQGPGSTLVVTVNTNTTPGAYINDLLVVTNLTLDPANSVLDVIPINVPPVGSTFVVAEYSGTLTGAFSAVTNYQGYAFTVSYATPGEITVTYTGAGNYYNWISPSPADWSVANDWDVLNVPNSANAVVLLTNGVECDYSSSDNYSIGQMSIAPWDSSSGSLVMSGGSLYVSNSLNYYDVTIGGRSGTNGVGGNIETSLTPSEGGSATASLTINNGTMTAVRAGSGDYNQDGFLVGLSTNTTGTFTINNGTLNALCGIEISIYGNGIFNINGGVVVDNGWFGVGRGSGSALGYGSAAFNMTAGAFYLLENSGGGTVGGNGALCLDQGSTNAQVNISGGTLYSGDIAFSGANLTPTPVDTLNISGGTLYIGYDGVYSNSTTMIPFVNISGGTFHTVFMLPSGGGGGTNGSINNIGTVGTNWTWIANPSVNLTNSSFSVNGSSGPGYVTFAPEANRTITLENVWSGVGGLTLNGPGNLALSAANTYTGGTTIDEGNLILLSAGSVADSSSIASISGSLTFSNSAAITFTNIVTGGANVSVSGGQAVNVGNNLQNTGAIVQNNGILVVNGTILNASSVTDSSPSSVGPFLAQGTITSPIGIGTNSSFEMGTTVQPGTLNASNVILNGTWIAKINTATTVGGGINDLLICSNLTLNPSSVLSIAAQTPLSVGTYVIAEFVNTNGTFGIFTNSTRDAVSLNIVPASGNTLGQVQLIVTSIGNPANLVWSAPIGATDINWDVNTSSNWTNTATSALDKFYQQDNVSFNLVTNGASAITNRVSVTGQVVPSSISISGGAAYLFSGAGEISGGTGINYNDTNTSGIYTGGNTYTGPVNINAGVLQLGLGGSSWLGESNTAYVNGGTLDLDGQNVGAEPLVLQGSGGGVAGTNGGAINNSSSTEPSQSGGPLNISLAGDTTFNASGNRWDVGVATLGAGGGSFAGNGYNLTKIGNQAIWIHEVGDIGVGNITISNGLLGFQYTVGMGNPADTVTVESNATLGIYQLNTNSLLNKQMVLNGNATLSTGGGAGSSNNFIGPITLNGTNTITTSIYPLNLPGSIMGTGGFILTGSGPLYLGGSDSYSGSTIMGAGSSLILGTGASLSGTPLIYMTPSTNTELGTVGGGSGTGAITLNSGQTLEGAGSINASNFVAPTASTIMLGTNPATATYGTIVFTNNLTLNGDTNYLKISDYNNAGIDNDLIQVNQQLTLSGNSTIVVTPLAALSAGNPYTIIEFGSIIGSANNLTVVSTSPRYNMTPVINGNDVQVNISGNAAPLEWKGYLTPNWDLVTSNWYNMGTANKDHFYNGDNPTFDDSSSVTSVVITNNVLVAGLNMSNVVNTYTFSGGGIITGPLNMEGNGNGSGGTLVLATSNAPAFTTLDSSAGTLVYDLQGVTNYTIAANITDNLGNQAGTIIFGGTNTALLEGDNVPAPYIGGSYNPDFDGTIMVTNGILEYTNVDSLGVDAVVQNNPAFSPLIITNNGTLNFNGVPAGTANGAPLGGQKWIHISGSGYNGQGALTDTAGNGEPSGAFCYLYLDGNATVGSMPGVRYDQHILSGNAQQVEGNGFNLTFTGGGYFVLYGQSDGDTHFGNIDVASTLPGRLLFQDGPIALGITTNYLFVESNAEVTFYAVTNELDPVHNGLDKIMWLKGDASVDSGGESNNFIGPVFLSGTNLIGTRTAMTLWGGIMDSNGPGGFILGNDSAGASGGNLWLEGTNSYSGPTIVSNETLYVGANSSLGLSTYVQVNSGATLNLSAMPVFNFGTVATNQTMAGNGTVIGPAGTGENINFNAGGTLAIGLPATNGFANTNTFTLTIDNRVVFNAGSTNLIGANKTSPSAGSVPVDEVSGMTSVTIGGTLVITNYGTSFVAGDTLKLFNATTYATNAYTIVPATPGPNLLWNISSIPVNGTLSVVSSVTINPNPTNIVFSVTNNQLYLSWPADHTGWQLQSQTNSLSVGITTNWVNVSGSTLTNQVIVPISLTNGSVFYRLTY